jgi:hypothetical protein
MICLHFDLYSQYLAKGRHIRRTVWKEVENNDMQLVDMKWIAATLKVTDKWIYKQIQDGKFMKP